MMIWVSAVPCPMEIREYKDDRGGGWVKRVFSKENLWALGLALLLVLLVILSSSDAPLWIYQGF